MVKDSKKEDKKERKKEKQRDKTFASLSRPSWWEGKIIQMISMPHYNFNRIP